MDAPYLGDSRPWTRWWWFNVELREEDIRAQLDWLRANGFGGVELAFVYPLPNQPRGPDWLSPEWSAAVALAKKLCDERGLGCDFTFGTLWPFGGTFVPESDSARTWEGPSHQRLGRSWELPREGRILNHLDAAAFERYAETMGAALAEALKGARSGLFCDSWEVETKGLWTDGFESAFEDVYGYELLPLMAALDSHPDARYDYRKLRAEFILDNFYQPFTEFSRKAGSFTRVQCHGAPVDLIAAYASADVPETESILFDPEFATIPASAAALRGAPVVSAEAFTCLYGWIPWPGPGQHQAEEQVADLKLLADALFANGANHIFWHGMPYSPPGKDNRFYASVHVGPTGSLAPHFGEFNAYLGKVSAALKAGRTYSDVAAYLPLEDAWMQGELPEELRKPSARYHWEMHHQRFPAALHGYHPLWVTDYFLRDARFEDGLCRCGQAVFRALVLDSDWLDEDALGSILQLARDGLPVCLLRRPDRPGRGKKHGFENALDALAALPNVDTDLLAAHPHPPLLVGDDLPDHWARVTDDGELVLFFGHPRSRGLTYPLAFGASKMEDTYGSRATLNWQGREVDLDLVFPPYQSLLLKVSKSGSVQEIDITYHPPEPGRP